LNIGWIIIVLNNNKHMYRIFDSVSYGHMEPLVPFTLIETFEVLTDAINFAVKQQTKHFIIDSNGKIINELA
jgi:hypothetical protein